MKVLVTGASGFIGRNLIKKILEREGVLVYAVSRTIPLVNCKNYIPVSVDITVKDWTNVIPSPVDTVIHLAQSNRYREFPEGAKDMIDINIKCTLELLEWSRNNKVRRFLFASTGNVYKRSTKLHMETDECEPKSLYDATKLSAEYLVKQYNMFYKTIIMRLFGVYGPGQKDKIIPTLIESVKRGKKIKLAQGIGAYLTPLYISDCVEMVVWLINHDFKNDDIEVYNLAGKEVIKLSDFVRMIEKLLHCKAGIDLVDDEAPFYLLGNIDKICKIINFKPSITIEKGLSKILSD